MRAGSVLRRIGTIKCCDGWMTWKYIGCGQFRTDIFTGLNSVWQLYPDKIKRGSKVPFYWGLDVMRNKILFVVMHMIKVLLLIMA